MDYQGYLWVHGQEPHSDQNKNVSVHEVPEELLGSSLCACIYGHRGCGGCEGHIGSM